ncbi:MAG: hypothetical protein KTR31_23910 [Myxococcales bacterium]|nr:hypothetical protein [Myxococcales bacterium]
MPSFTVLSALLVHAPGCSGPDVPAGAPDDAARRTESVPPPPDPATDQPYRCISDAGWVELLNGSSRARIFRPADEGGGCTDAWPSRQSGFPLVLVAHGNGYDDDQYEYLASHLAHQGFVVAMVDTPIGGTNSGISDALLNFWGALPDWSDAAFVGDQLALVGHSRGGEGVVRTAQRFHDEGWSGSVEAVVSLAPSDVEDLQMTEEQVPALLVMTASRDSDLAGRQLDGGFTQGPLERTGFMSYDRAPSYRAHLHVHGGVHHGFADKVTLDDYDAEISLNDQREITKTYVAAFLRWQVLGQVYKPFFTGQWSSAVVEETGVDVGVQYDDLHGRALARFEGDPHDLLDKIIADSSISFEQSLSELWGADAVEFPFSSPHQTEGLEVRWDAEGTLRFTLEPSDSDVSDFDHLTFRIAQLYDSPLADGEPLALTVELMDNQAVVDGTSLAHWATIPYPEMFVPEQLEAKSSETVVGENYTKSAMRTVRIPLSVFQVDLQQLYSVRFVLGTPGSERGHISLDDLTFTR